MLITQIGYFGHHLEKSLKMRHRAGLGAAKAERLAALLREHRRRQPGESGFIRWAREMLRRYEARAEGDGPDIDSPTLAESTHGIAARQPPILEAIRARRSVRFWRNESVPPSTIEQIISAGFQAANTCSRNQLRVLVCRNNRCRREAHQADVRNENMLEIAPVVLYVGADTRFYGFRYEGAIDAGNFAATASLAAETYGLGVAQIYQSEKFDHAAARKRHGFPAGFYVYVAMAMGYPGEVAQKPVRPQAADRVVWSEAD
jgi:nitroreductase